MIKKVRVIASNSEKFLAFQLGQMRILDSIQFLNASLDTLVKTLVADDPNKFEHLKRHFSDKNEFNMLLRKGVYCYEAMTDRSNFTNTELPPIEAFFHD